MKRLRTIKVRVSDDEHELIRERCDRPQLADWLRDLALGQRKRRPVPRADPELLRQLAGIGNNVNQIARWCNGQQPVDAVAVSAALIALSRELEGIRVASQDQQQG